MSNPFDYLTAINEKKPHELDPNQFPSFMCNRGLSYFRDTVLFANELNMRQNIPPDQQFAFLLEVVSKRVRRSKWAKPEQDDTIELIQEAYQVSRNRAREIALLLNAEQLQTLRDRAFKGGRAK